MLLTSGCGLVVKEPVELPNNPTVITSEVGQVVTNSKDTVTSESVNYLIDCDDENTAISPISLKGAMALVALSTEGETQNEIVKALGHESVDDVAKWYKSLQEYCGKVESKYDSRTLEIANAVWLNTDNAIGGLKEEYRKTLADKLGATSDKGNTQVLNDKINSWADEKTHGLIKEIVMPAMIADSVVVLSNATYLKGSWAGEFYEMGQKKFTTIDGTKVDKEFVERDDGGLYYKDDSIECTTVNIGGGLQMILAKGDQSKLYDAVHKMKDYDEVHIEMPKMDIESDWASKDVFDTLKNAGINKAFTGGAEFVQITEGDNLLEIGSILQKCKVLTDEKGIEAAAVTVVTFDNMACLEPVETTRAEFLANEPYYFYVYANTDFYSGSASDDSYFNELLFCGKYVK